jgi:dTDP-4-dehydrorhamnose 3,5-epimerase-like enzyme
MQIRKFKFNGHKNETGSLVFLEAAKDVPFEIKRVYYLYGIENGARRGFHAHKNLLQAYICVYGSCKVLLDDGKEKTDVILDDPSEGLFLEKNTWREIYDFSPGAVLLVLASEHYDEDDYIRNYDDFIKYLDLGEVKK